MERKEIENVKRLASINASGDSITESEFLERRTIVEFLEKSGVIELAIPKENGQFVFTSKEPQDLYLKAFEEKRIDISRAATSKLEGIYMLVKWPESQLIMDEEWFDKECHLADMERDPDVGSSAYFVPVKRLNELETKLKDIEKAHES